MRERSRSSAPSGRVRRGILHELRVGRLATLACALLVVRPGGVTAQQTPRRAVEKAAVGLRSTAIIERGPSFPSSPSHLSRSSSSRPPGAHGRLPIADGLPADDDGVPGWVRGTVIGAIAGALVGTVVWSLSKEADDDSLLNPYLTGGGAAAGALTGLAIALVF